MQIQLIFCIQSNAALQPGLNYYKDNGTASAGGFLTMAERMKKKATWNSIP